VRLHASSGAVISEALGNEKFGLDAVHEEDRKAFSMWLENTPLLTKSIGISFHSL
jgi:hypothetical protein